MERNTHLAGKPVQELFFACRQRLARQARTDFKPTKQHIAISNADACRHRICTRVSDRNDCAIKHFDLNIWHIDYLSDRFSNCGQH